MNWGEFKAALETQGVNDETDIAFIDYDGSMDHLKVEKDDSGRIDVVESWLPVVAKQPEGSDVI